MAIKLDSIAINILTNFIGEYLEDDEILSILKGNLIIVGPGYIDSFTYKTDGSIKSTKIGESVLVHVEDSYAEDSSNSNSQRMSLKNINQFAEKLEDAAKLKSKVVILVDKVHFKLLNLTIIPCGCECSGQSKIHKKRLPVSSRSGEICQGPVYDKQGNFLGVGSYPPPCNRTINASNRRKSSTVGSTEICQRFIYDELGNIIGVENYPPPCDSSDITSAGLRKSPIQPAFTEICQRPVFDSHGNFIGVENYPCP